MRSCLLLLVERAPGTAELRLRLVDLLDEAGDEGGLGVEQRQPVVLFDQEDGIEAPGERVVDPGADLVACLSERAATKLGYSCFGACTSSRIHAYSSVRPASVSA